MKTLHPQSLSWLLAREADRDDLPINAALVDRKGSISGYFPTESKQTKAVLESLGYLAPWVSVRAVGGTEISDTMLRNVFVFSKELWASAAAAYFPISVPGQSFCPQRMLKRNIDRLLKKSRAWM